MAPCIALKQAYPVGESKFCHGKIGVLIGNIPAHFKFQSGLRVGNNSGRTHVWAVIPISNKVGVVEVSGCC